MARKLKSSGAGGQDTPPPNFRTLEVLQWGCCLLAMPSEFDMRMAEPAWRVHRERALADWAQYWQERSTMLPNGVLPSCFGERVFDGKAQIPTAGLPDWTDDRICSVEAEVREYLRTAKRKK